MIYWTILISLLILSLIEIAFVNSNVSIKSSKWIIILYIVILIVLAGGRENTGLDYNGYLGYFNSIKNGKMGIINRIVEPGYVILNWLMPSYRILLFMMAILAVIIKYKAFIELNVKHIIFMLFTYYATYYLFYEMGVMRQGVAIAICLYSVKYIKGRNSRQFLICMLCALAFHISSVAFIPLYFIADKKFKMKTYIMILAISVAIIMLDINLVNIMGSISGIVHSEFLVSKISFYEIPTALNSLKGTVIKRALFGVLFVVLSSRQLRNGRHLTEWGEKENSYTWICVNGYTMSVFFLAIFYAIGLHTIAGRFAASLYALYWLIYDQLLCKYNKRLFKFCLFIVFCSMSIYTFYETLNESTGNTYLNYKFFLN